MSHLRIISSGAVIALAIGFGGAAGNRPAHSELVHTDENCWDCENCSGGSHQDYLQIDENLNFYTGGTFVNVCGYAYSNCPGNHNLCEPTFASTEVPELTYENISILEAELLSGSASRQARALSSFAWADLVEEGRVVEVRDCHRHLVARLPIASVVTD